MEICTTKKTPEWCPCKDGGDKVDTSMLRGAKISSLSEIKDIVDSIDGEFSIMINPVNMFGGELNAN